VGRGVRGVVTMVGVGESAAGGVEKKGKIGEIPILLAFEYSCTNTNFLLLEILHP
jgi:hypothetical protein